MGYRIWQFAADMNGDGVVTISDVWLWFKWLYFYPGDGLLYFLVRGAESIAKFFEVTPDSFGGAFSGVASFFAWLIVLGGFAALNK
jgi:hypothetical protein